MESLLTEFEKRREALIDDMVEMTNRPDVSDAEGRQMVTGFVYLIEQCLQGNDEARAHYLTTVIPGLSASGMPFSVVMEAMVRCAVSLSSSFADNREHVKWLTVFLGDYTRDLVHAWYGEAPDG